MLNWQQIKTFSWKVARESILDKSSSSPLHQASSVLVNPDVLEHHIVYHTHYIRAEANLSSAEGQVVT